MNESQKHASEKARHNRIPLVQIHLCEVQEKPNESVM